MKYRFDPDLDFLKNIESKKLSYLGNILLYDRIGRSRSTAFDESFETLHIDENDREIKDWQVFAMEVQYFGGNTLVNRVRRGGVYYKDIVDDVCGKMELADYLKGKAVEEKERCIISEIQSFLLHRVQKSHPEEVDFSRNWEK